MYTWAILLHLPSVVSSTLRPVYGAYVEIIRIGIPESAWRNVARSTRILCLAIRAICFRRNSCIAIAVPPATTLCDCTLVGCCLGDSVGIRHVALVLSAVRAIIPQWESCSARCVLLLRCIFPHRIESGFRLTIALSMLVNVILAASYPGCFCFCLLFLFLASVFSSSCLLFPFSGYPRPFFLLVPVCFICSVVFCFSWSFLRCPIVNAPVCRRCSPGPHPCRRLWPLQECMLFLGLSRQGKPAVRVFCCICVIGGIGR